MGFTEDLMIEMTCGGKQDTEGITEGIKKGRSSSLSKEPVAEGSPASLKG